MGLLLLLLLDPACSFARSKRSLTVVPDAGGVSAGAVDADGLLTDTGGLLTDTGGLLTGMDGPAASAVSAGAHPNRTEAIIAAANGPARNFVIVVFIIKIPFTIRYICHLAEVPRLLSAPAGATA